MSEWKHILKMPNVDNPHAAVFSFLRTSEWGEWRIAEDKPNDVFVQHFRRGKTIQIPRFIWGVHEEPLAPNLTAPLEHVFMELRATFRPLPDILTIGLYHSVFWPCSGRLDKRVSEYIVAEAQALATYLREFYDLPETPQIAAE